MERKKERKKGDGEINALHQRRFGTNVLRVVGEERDGIEHSLSEEVVRNRCGGFGIGVLLESNNRQESQLR